jgi:hypothetical protein
MQYNNHNHHSQNRQATANFSNLLPSGSRLVSISEIGITLLKNLLTPISHCILPLEI